MIIVPQTVTTAKASVEVELDHQCEHCGAVSPAMVSGRAVASEQRFIFEAGSSDAQFLAETEAQRDAALLIRVVRCPRCQRRNAAELRTLWMPMLWMALGATALAIAGLAVVPLVMLVLIGGLAFGVRAVKALRGSDRRVRFLDTTARATQRAS